MTLQRILGWLGSLVIVGCGGLVLWAIVRFSIVSPRRTRGWRDRLRKPNLSEVESQWNLRLPRSIESFFHGDLVELSELYFSPPGADEVRWYVAHVIPFTSRDLSEWSKITRVQGLPIAVDGSKGTYYLPFADLRQGKSTVLFRGAGKNQQDRQVATSIDLLKRFRPMEISGDDL